MPPDQQLCHRRLEPYRCGSAEVHAQPVPIKLGRRVVSYELEVGLGGAVQPEAPHEARFIVPRTPIVAPVVASMEDVVRAQNDGAGAKRSHFKLLDKVPLQVGNCISHPNVVRRATVNDVVFVV